MAEGTGIAHRIDGEGILHVAFGRPGGRVNLLNEQVLQALRDLLREARDRDEIRAVLFLGTEPGMFLAGLDVRQIAAVTDAYRAAEGARFGQSVFQQIADLDRPTACAIGGTCLGGGTELALACDFRVAADDRAVRIGLPEVRLGVIPGFGGTQRLPRRVGLTRALDLILSGRGLDSARAHEFGLVDRVVPPAYLERETLALLRRAISEGTESVVAAVRKKRPIGGTILEKIRPLRNYVLDQTRKRIGKRVSAQDYPAPFRAIEAVEAALVQPLAQGLDFEARIVGELVPTRTCKNLLWLFKNHREVKSESAGLNALPRRIARLGVVGAGVMGAGIARLSAEHEVPVRLKDLQFPPLLGALRMARSIWARRVENGKAAERRLQQKLAFIAPTLNDSGMAHVDMVIEAVVENLEVKRQVLAEVERRIDERAVFASNTSSLSIAQIASGALHPERVVGLHFFNPVHRMSLVEVIPGRHSSPEAVATARAFAIRLGRLPIIVRDEPGFLVNRILTLYMNEAIVLLAEGSRVEAIDSAMTAFGMPIGPFALLDRIGLETAEQVDRVLRPAFGPRIGGDGAVLRAMLSASRLGRKNGRGFYRYRDGRRTVADPEIRKLLGLSPARDLPAETLQERMLLSMVNEAAFCLQERVVHAPRELDMALVMGTGFPAHRGGLLHYADRLGVPVVVDRLSRLADAHGERFRPAESMQQMVREQRRFHPE